MSDASRRSRLLPFLNVVVAQGNLAFTMAGSFILTPTLLHVLGDASYGIWLLINSFIQYMRMLELGTSSGTMKYGAGAYERGDSGDLAKVFNTTSAVYLVVGGAAALASVGLAAALPRLYPVLGGQGAIILTLGAATALDLVMRPFSAGLRVRSLFFANDGTEILTYAVFKFGLVLYLARTGLDFRILCRLTLLETVVRNAIVAAMSLWWCPYTRSMRPLRADREMFKRFAAMGAAVSIMQVADVVRFQLDSAVIGWFLPSSPEQIAVFGIGSRLTSIAYYGVAVIGAVMIPRFSGLSEKGDQAGTERLLRRTSLATGLVAVYLFANVAILGPHFLVLWLHKPWVGESAVILRILIPAYFLTALTQPGSGLLVANGKLRGQAAITVVEAILNLGMSVALARPLGIFGVALGTAVPMVIVRGVVFPWLVKQAIGVSPATMLAHNKTALILGAVYVALIAGLGYVPCPSFLRFALLGGASTLLYVLLLVVALPEVRAAVLRRLGRGATA